jgi:hypothetical protein
LTIGATYDSIEQKINKLFLKEPMVKPDSNSLYSRINEEIKIASTQPNETVNILILLRDFLGFIKHNNLYLSSQIDELEKRPRNHSIFPNKIREDILDLLRYRNATAHKSRIPIGNYEALKSIYCCSCVILWWIEEKRCIDWRLTKDEILKQLVEKNSKKI